jgi:hypothetical protein
MRILPCLRQAYLVLIAKARRRIVQRRTHRDGLETDAGPGQDLKTT